MDKIEEHTHASRLLVGGRLGVAPDDLNVLKRLDGEFLKGSVRSENVTAVSNMRTKNG
ncbi:hypothetical protein PITC_048150 [Penicillium italicum]|uniref:Uncharacterized protein n=1 Tax=Penicillium italicum TaxID=40296 RepID=A0A0A2LBF6_PENIT|nr:hypothetical protein PITC_048150 [Penicillium italicum]